MLFLERSRCVTLLKNAIRYETSVIKFRDRSTLIKGPPRSNSAGTCVYGYLMHKSSLKLEVLVAYFLHLSHSKADRESFRRTFGV